MSKTQQVTKHDAQFEYIFDVNDTFLHSMFSQINADKIEKLINNKILFLLLIIAALIGEVLAYIQKVNEVSYTVYWLTLYLLVIIPWLIVKHLSFNKHAFKLCIKTFDYWIKNGYGIMFCAAFAFRNTAFNILNIIFSCVNMVAWVMIISLISSFDAVHTSKCKKFLISAGPAMLFSLNAILFQFFVSEEYYILPTISSRSIIASSSRVLAIFLWKQTINTWYRKGNAVSISCVPNVIWTDITTNSQLQTENIHMDYVNMEYIK
eukprot:490463_1